MENQTKSVLIDVPTFVVSFIEERPLYDGSQDTQEYFVCRHYRNFALIREEIHPVLEFTTPQNQPDNVADYTALEDMVDDNGNPIKLDLNDAESI